MGEKPDEIREEIRRTRNRLDQHLNSLEYEVKRATDWRVHFDRHPWLFVGAAFSGALLLGWTSARPAARY